MQRRPMTPIEARRAEALHTLQILQAFQQPPQTAKETA